MPLSSFGKLCPPLPSQPSHSELSAQRGSMLSLALKEASGNTQAPRAPASAAVTHRRHLSFVVALFMHSPKIALEGGGCCRPSGQRCTCHDLGSSEAESGTRVPKQVFCWGCFGVRPAGLREAEQAGEVTAGLAKGQSPACLQPVLGVDGSQSFTPGDWGLCSHHPTPNSWSLASGCPPSVWGTGTASQASRDSVSHLGLQKRVQL